MTKIFIIAKWELLKLVDNWKKAAAVFLLPAAIMMVALNIFPMLVNYLTTGNFGNHTIMVIDAPDSFKDYVEDIDGTTVYKFEFLSAKQFNKLGDEEEIRLLNKGIIFVDFNVGYKTGDFDKEVSNYYSELSKGNENAKSRATIFVGFSENIAGMDIKAEQFQETILDPYNNSLLDTLGGDYVSMGASLFSTNEFNPVGKILDYRTVANSSASRVIPGIIVLLMYYCTYSLASDIFAAEKERGFYNKLVLTPVSRKNIFLGKLIAIEGIVTVSALVTFTMMFFSSWLNRSNDAMSLLPFGMFLTPAQLGFVILEILPAAFLMGVIAINIIFNTEKIQDIITCLQFPLILFLFEFFIHMFRYSRPVWLEYCVPLHNTIQVLRDVFMSEEKIVSAVIVFVLNTIVAIHVFRKTLRKELSK